MTLKCPSCGADAGLPPYTCGHCGAVIHPCPTCHGHGVVIAGGRALDDQFGGLRAMLQAKRDAGL